MPCWTVQTMSVEFHVEHADLLAEALKKIGMVVARSANVFTVEAGPSTITIDLNTGRAEVPTGEQGRLNAIRRAYSREAINRVARRNLWSNKTTSDKSGVLQRF